MSATNRFHQLANDALVMISENLNPGAKLALVIYTPGNPELDIALTRARRPIIGRMYFRMKMAGVKPNATNTTTETWTLDLSRVG